jgi:hypothetical protein
MLITFFYFILVPSILAFFLGYIAHGLKTVTKTASEASESASDPMLAGQGDVSISPGAEPEETLPA